MALRQTILTVLAHRKRTGYEIARDFDQVMSHLWSASHQQIYRELGRLTEDGCVTFTVMPQKGKPDKKLYALTKAGRVELRRWVGNPTPPPRPQNEFLVKILAGVLVDKPAIRREVARVQTTMAALSQQLQAMRQACDAVPNRTDYDQTLNLQAQLGAALVAAHVEWLKDVAAHLKK